MNNTNKYLAITSSSSVFLIPCLAALPTLHCFDIKGAIIISLFALFLLNVAAHLMLLIRGEQFSLPHSAVSISLCFFFLCLSLTYVLGHNCSVDIPLQHEQILNIPLIIDCVQCG